MKYMSRMDRIVVMWFFIRVVFWFAAILFITCLTSAGIMMVRVPDHASNFYGSVILTTELVAGIYVGYIYFQRWKFLRTIRERLDAVIRPMD